MKSVSISYLRYNMGAMFHEIKHHGASFLLVKGGKPVARLLPLEHTVIEPNGAIIGEIPLTKGRHL